MTLLRCPDQQQLLGRHTCTPPPLRKRQSSAVLRDGRWSVPKDFPPWARGRPLYLLFHLYLGTRRSELYNRLSHQGLWKDPRSSLPVLMSEFKQVKFHSVPTKNSCLALGSSSTSHSNPPQREGSQPSCLQPFQMAVPGHTAGPSSPIFTSACPPAPHPACPAWSCTADTAFPCNSHTSSKQQTIESHLNHPQFPVAGEQCSINKAGPAASRTVLCISAGPNQHKAFPESCKQSIPQRQAGSFKRFSEERLLHTLCFQSLAQRWSCSSLSPRGHIRLLTLQGCNTFKAIWCLTLRHLNYNTAFQAETQTPLLHLLLQLLYSS